MILRSPISGAKKLFSKTLKSFKSFFNGDSYEKLPKVHQATTPSPFSLNPNPSTSNLHQHRTYDSGKLYITEKWDSENGTRKKIATEQDKEVVIPLKNMNRNRPDKSSSVAFHGRRVETTKEEDSSCSRNRDWVLKKLKELKRMDRNNIEHVMDIEEVLHYYSLLTCPSYLEIVDKFFVEIYADLLVSDTPVRRTLSNPSSRAKLGIRDESRVLPKGTSNRTIS